jgi:hypothetical protein
LASDLGNENDGEWLVTRRTRPTRFDKDLKSTQSDRVAKGVNRHDACNIQAQVRMTSLDQATSFTGIVESHSVAFVILSRIWDPDRSMTVLAGL